MTSPPIRRAAAVLTFLALAAFAPRDARAQRQDRKPTPNDALNSVEIDPDRKVTFRIYAPKADEVTVGGDFAKRAAMAKAENGVWSLTVGPLAPDYYSYTFEVDGVRTVDPKSGLVKPGVGSLDSVFFVPAPRPLLFTEAAVRLDERQPQQALALLEALHERNATYTGLEVQFGIVADRLINAAQGESDHRAARFFLRRLARRYANHRIVKEWTARFTQQTRELLDKAVTSDRSGHAEEALDFVETAARIWPELPEVSADLQSSGRSLPETACGSCRPARRPSRGCCRSCARRALGGRAPAPAVDSDGLIRAGPFREQGCPL